MNDTSRKQALLQNTKPSSFTLTGWSKGRRLFTRTLALTLGLLPAIFLNAETVVYQQDFESFTPQSGVDWYGNASTQDGLWGPFDPDNHPNRLSTARARSGTQSLRLEMGVDPQYEVFGGITDQVLVGSGAASAKKFELSFSIYRDRMDTGVNDIIAILSWSYDDPFSGMDTTNPAGNIYIGSTANRVRIYDQPTGSALFSELDMHSVPAGEWVDMRFVYDLTAGEYGQVSGYRQRVGRDEDYLGTIALAAAFMPAADRFAFRPLGTNGTVNYFDDFKLTVIPEPSSTGCLLGLVGVLLIMVRRFYRKGRN